MSCPATFVIGLGVGVVLALTIQGIYLILRR
jgi:hypothetical protein